MPNDGENQTFQFEISLSVLNHLGRNLYRNFITVLGEAISNSWDADAKNVWIDIDRESSVFSIKDDGIGMDSNDFQSKFLKIGYSKRSEGNMQTPGDRPYIGAKGIGKLALLSCAKRISVFTKTEQSEYVGGVIDNGGLDEAIHNNLTPEDYPLEGLNFELINKLSEDHHRGTIIVFEDTKDQIRNSLAHIKKMLALSFRFSLIDKDFSIFVNGEEVSIADISDVLSSTEFVWLINEHEDDFVSAMDNLKSDQISLIATLDIHGFIASVEKPRNLKITGTDERATIDLFVNGRLREKNILRHIPTQRIVESYLYGQVHFDSMDELGKDPFTSSREGVKEEDEKFRSLLEYLKSEALPVIFDKWDELRIGRGAEGDEENPRKTKKDRKASDLYSATREEYKPEEGAPTKNQVDEWLKNLRADAEYNLSAYVDCFLSENLVRQYLHARGAALSPQATTEVDEWRKREATRKAAANLSFAIRKDNDDLSYLGMDYLALGVEGNKATSGEQSLWTDAISYKPVRNAVGHTGLLTDVAKAHLSVTRENIKARVNTLLSEEPEEDK